MGARPRLLVDEPPLLVLPTLARQFGLFEAIVLAQLDYWLRQAKAQRWEGSRWVYNNYVAWQRQFPFWSVATVKRVFLNIERQGIVRSRQFEKGGWNRRKWYTIDYERLAHLMGQVGADRQDSSHRSAQSDPIDGLTLSHSIGAICTALDAATTTSTTADNTSSTAAAASAADGLGDLSLQNFETDSTQAGELHPDVIALVQNMVTTAFHSLAEPTQVNEHFWDAHIDLIHAQTRLTLADIIRDIDAYYAAHPVKIPQTPEAAIACMGYGIKFALDKAQKRRRR
jgi:hypothetical protein